VFDLLAQNYVEDDDEMFRFQYSQEFLKWALQPPGYHVDWHLGVRVKGTGKLVVRTAKSRPATSSTRI